MLNYAWGETAWGYNEVISGIISIRRISKIGVNGGRIISRSKNSGEVLNG